MRVAICAFDFVQQLLRVRAFRGVRVVEAGDCVKGGGGEEGKCERVF